MSKELDSEKYRGRAKVLAVDAALDRTSDDIVTQYV